MNDTFHMTAEGEAIVAKHLKNCMYSPSAFRAVETPWGTMILHNSNTVWYKYYDPYVSNGIKKGDVWIAYHTSRDNPSNTPWCQDAIRIGEYKTEKLAIQKCLERVELKKSLTNGTFKYT